MLCIEGQYNISLHGQCFRKVGLL